ncbi:hypothetical protein BCR43DRAFT_487721 [Syncephalastrum racemosum]|uniref:Chromo domain-containing protein n=1 Tax=Syncephalastrum racemosum TaxID=13706 RepID=A0A1X2HHK0_SYNRA|nr:hypothetical protein BCR43DRAFT_487721 [Syncephalastrum racemosum]
MSASDEDVYEVEAILHHRARRARGGDVLEYEIKWVGYSEDDNTWERESNINAGDLLRNYWQQFGGEKAHQEAIEKARGSSKSSAKTKKRGRPSKESPAATNETEETKARPEKETHTERDTHTGKEAALPSKEASPEWEAIISDKEDTEEYIDVTEAATVNEAAVEEDHQSPVLGLPEEGLEDSDYEPEVEELATKASAVMTSTETVPTTETKRTLSTARFRRGKHSVSSAPEPAAKRARNDLDSEQEDEDEYMLKTTEQDTAKESPAYMTYPTDKKSSRLEDTFETKKLAKIGTQDVIFDANWPPASMSWEKDAVSVEYVVKEPSVTELKDVNSLYAVVKWRGGLISMHPCSLVREKCPNQLIAFYESRLMFRN